MTKEKTLERGFNDGYQLMKLKPEIALKLMDSFKDQNHRYVYGFGSGILEVVAKELSQESIRKLEERIKKLSSTLEQNDRSI